MSFTFMFDSFLFTRSLSQALQATLAVAFCFCWAQRTGREPILRGIRLNDLSLILAGAIPAALLALLLQLLIDMIEWAVTPRGLKRGAEVRE